MADIKISKELFFEICKYHLYDPEEADQYFIITELNKKLEKAAARERYTAALFAENNPPVSSQGARIADKGNNRVAKTRKYNIRVDCHKPPCDTGVKGKQGGLSCF